MPFQYVGRLQSPYQPGLSQGFQAGSNLFSNILLQAISQNFRKKEAEIQREHEQKLAETQKRYQLQVGGAEKVKPKLTPTGMKKPTGAVSSETGERKPFVDVGQETFMMPEDGVRPVSMGGETVGFTYRGRFYKGQDQDQTQTYEPKPVVLNGKTVGYYSPKTGTVSYLPERGGAGGLKGRTAEMNWWANKLGMDLTDKSQRASVQKIMDQMYGRGDKDKELFMQAYRASHDSLATPDENLKAAQELYNKVMLSEQNRDAILEQYPDAQYDFAQSKWYVQREGKKYWIEAE